MVKGKQLNKVIIKEKIKLNKMVKSQKDLTKEEAIKQSQKLDRLVVLAMDKQCRQKKS